MFSKGRSQDPTPVQSEPRNVKQEARVPSIVSPELTINGNMASRGDIQVDGTVHGDVEAETLTVGENGAIHGTVTANTLRVRGTVDGEIHAATVNLMSSARIYGDIVHSSLAIEAGALLEGHCRRRDSESMPHGQGAEDAATQAQPLYSLSGPAKKRARNANGRDEDIEDAEANAAVTEKPA